LVDQFNVAGRIGFNNTRLQDLYFRICVSNGFELEF
jgi:hypothetical protein